MYLTMRWGALQRLQIISFQLPQNQTMSCRVVSCRVVSCRVVSCRVVACREVSCRVVTCRVLSCRVVSCRVMSGNNITCVCGCNMTTLNSEKRKISKHFHFIRMIILKISSTHFSTVSTHLQVFEVSNNLEMCVEVFYLTYLSMFEVWGFWGFHEYGDLKCGYGTVRLGNYPIFLENVLASSGGGRRWRQHIHSIQWDQPIKLYTLVTHNPHRQNPPCTSDIYYIPLSWDISFLSSVKLKLFPI